MPATGDHSTKPYPFTDTKGRKYRWSDKKQSYVYEDGARVPSNREVPQPTQRRESLPSRAQDSGPNIRVPEVRQVTSSSARGAGAERTQSSGRIPIPGSSAPRGDVEVLGRRLETTYLGSSPRTHAQFQSGAQNASLGSTPLRAERRPSTSQHMPSVQYSRRDNDGDGDSGEGGRGGGSAGGGTSASVGMHPLLFNPSFLRPSIAGSLILAPANKFALGTVLEILRDETHSSSGAASGTSKHSHGNTTRSRKKVVVVNSDVRGDGHAFGTVPIETYNGEGLARPGVVKSYHAIIYTSRHPPELHRRELPVRAANGTVEQGAQTQPLLVRPLARDAALDEMSRLNLSDYRTIAYNTPGVRVYGRIHRDSERSLQFQFQAVQTALANARNARTSSLQAPEPDVRSNKAPMDIPSRTQEPAIESASSTLPTGVMTVTEFRKFYQRLIDQAKRSGTTRPQGLSRAEERHLAENVNARTKALTNLRNIWKSELQARRDPQGSDDEEGVATEDGSDVSTTLPTRRTSVVRRKENGANGTKRYSVFDRSTGHTCVVLKGPPSTITSDDLQSQGILAEKVILVTTGSAALSSGTNSPGTSSGAAGFSYSSSNAPLSGNASTPGTSQPTSGAGSAGGGGVGPPFPPLVYSTSRNPRRDWAVGNVIEFFYTEPQEDAASVITQYLPITAPPRQRAVVIASGSGQSAVLLIRTYGGRGVAGAGARRRDFHSIIHSAEQAPSPLEIERPRRGEADVLREPPVRVIPQYRDWRLDSRSRLNYADIVELRWDRCDICVVGHIAQWSWQPMITNFHEVQRQIRGR